MIPNSAAEGARQPRLYSRWVVANVATAVPQSMAPIVFSMAMAARGDLNLGALMIMVMTSAQVVGAVPIAAAGARFSPAGYARMLAATRTLAFSGLAISLAVAAPLAIILICVGFAGLVNGALVGVLRALLNSIVSADRLTRAVGIVATANELVFVIAPALAAIVANLSITTTVWLMAVASAVPIFVLPYGGSRPSRLAHDDKGKLPSTIVVWLVASMGSTACIASIEVGAVALALGQGFSAGAALLFVVPLCVASVLGGVWISVRNRPLPPKVVVLMLVLTGVGAYLVVWDRHIIVMIGGAVLMGFFLAPLSTSFSLVLDSILPAGRRPEGFALQRTAQSVGLIVASSFITFSSVGMALAFSGLLAMVSAIAVTTLHARRG